MEMKCRVMLALGLEYSRDEFVQKKLDALLPEHHANIEKMLDEFYQALHNRGMS